MSTTSRILILVRQNKKKSSRFYMVWKILWDPSVRRYGDTKRPSKSDYILGDLLLLYICLYFLNFYTSGITQYIYTYIYIYLWLAVIPLVHVRLLPAQKKIKSIRRIIALRKRNSDELNYPSVLLFSFFLPVILKYFVLPHSLHHPKPVLFGLLRTKAVPEKTELSNRKEVLQTVKILVETSLRYCLS